MRPDRGERRWPLPAVGPRSQLTGLQPWRVRQLAEGREPEGAFDNGTTSTIPCPSVSETVPNVVGMYTPTGGVRVQEAGLQPAPEQALFVGTQRLRHRDLAPGRHENLARLPK